MVHIEVLFPAAMIAVQMGVVTVAQATLVSAYGRPANLSGPSGAAVNPADELARAPRHRTAQRTPQPATIAKTWSRRRAAVSTQPSPSELDQSTRRPVETHNADRGRLALTTRESDLLVFLPRHPARAWSRAELLDKIWGRQLGDQSTVTVSVRAAGPDPGRPGRAPANLTVWGRLPLRTDDLR